MNHHFAKIQLTGTLEVKTGLHIGASNAFAAIGATDHPVIKDPLTNLPVIPGSSLKGKMRSLLAKAYNEQLARTPNDDHPIILRLFGSTNSKEDVETKIARLVFRDAILSNSAELFQLGAKTLTEVKFENTIDRIRVEAKPRQIERIIPGSQFDLEIMYTLDNEADVLEDLTYLKEGLTLLTLDYLGGHGSRGYGRIVFTNLKARCVFGNISTQLLDKINEQFASLSK